MMAGLNQGILFGFFALQDVCLMMSLACLYSIYKCYKCVCDGHQ